MTEFIAYTDGSYDMDSHYGASAIVLMDKDERQVIYEKASARLVIPSEEKQQFAKEQELAACYMAVANVPEGSRLTIKSDSQYCVKVLSGQWNASANIGIIDKYFSLVRRRKVDVAFVKVRGHSGARGGQAIWGNDRADELCTAACEQLKNYGVKTIVSRQDNPLLPPSQESV